MRTPLPLHAEDISAFARSLGGQLAGRDGAPGHLELLNMLARSMGFRNFQHLRAQQERLSRLAAPAEAPRPPLQPESVGRLKRLVRLFDAAGRLVRWPSRRGLEQSCLWAVWARIPPRLDMSEAELREHLRRAHSFDDHALLRRGLVDCGLMTRTPDGRVYRRVEAKPTAEALALLDLLRARAGQP